TGLWVALLVSIAITILLLCRAPLPEPKQDLPAAQQEDRDRERYQQRHPKAGAHGTSHLARVACADGLGGERRDSGDKTESEGEADEVRGMSERGRRYGLIAEPADEGEVGGHHRDLAEL